MRSVNILALTAAIAFTTAMGSGDRHTQPDTSPLGGGGPCRFVLQDNGADPINGSSSANPAHWTISCAAADISDAGIMRAMSWAVVQTFPEDCVLHEDYSVECSKGGA